jgi:hypothetical protein
MTLYQEIRAAGKTLHAKALDATEQPGFHPAQIARRMTLPMSGRTLLFDGEGTQNAFFDFWFHEFRVHGKSLVESVDQVAAGLGSLETEILLAHRLARTSLFLTEAVLPATHQIRLRNLLAPEQPAPSLTDVGLCDSLQRAGRVLAVFCRLLVVRKVTLTSGFNFAFEPARVPGLLDGYHKRIKKVPPADQPEARFVFFFQKHRQFGKQQGFQDVV